MDLYLSVGQLCFLIRQRVSMRPEEALFFFVNNSLPPSSSPLSVVYEVIHKHTNKHPHFVPYHSYTLCLTRSPCLCFGRNIMKRICSCIWRTAMKVFMVPKKNQRNYCLRQRKRWMGEALISLCSSRLSLVWHWISSYLGAIMGFDSTWNSMTV